ncbi:MAG: alpha/beta fold hydrolase [Nanoarchaeota archaeon]|nr:alpha/beta fold hydrolase [Nanoarchaeota archaeon]
MTTIFYSVGGEGMGHATRSEVVIRHLLLQGHNLIIFSYERAFDYLKESFKTEKNILELVKITGINFVHEKNKFELGKTIIKESKKIHGLLIKNLFIFLDRILKYKPSLIITDFEPLSGNIARLLKIPLICIDNISFITKCQIDNKFKNSIDWKFNEQIIKNFDGNCNFITTVFDAPLKEKYKNKTYLVGPIIRECFNNAEEKEKNFVLVYQTSKSNNKLSGILKQSDEKYIVYGFNKDCIDKNLTFKKQSRDGFARDLISCKAIITNGGFTLISEAVILKKPIYSIPIKRQIEQEMNGYYIAKSGFGTCSKEINKGDLNEFLDNLGEYRKNLSRLRYNKNELFSLLDKKVNHLANSYIEPTRLRMMIKIKKIYDSLIRQPLNIIGISKRTKDWIASDLYLATKAYLISKLSIKSKKHERCQSDGMDEILDLDIIEKNLVLNSNERISYGLYKSHFKSDKCFNLLFLHGLGGNKSVFIDLMLKILEISKEKINFRILMVDLAGHGKSTNFKSLEKYNFLSQSRFIRKIVDKEFEKCSEINLAGHCFGSFIAIKLTTLLKERVKHLFLISSNPFSPKSKKINFGLIRNKVMQKSLKLLFKKVKLPKNLINYDYKAYQKSADYNMRRIFVDIKNTSLKGYFASLYYLSFDSIYDDFQKLLHQKTKIIMIHGKKDRVFPYKEIEEKAKKGDVKLVMLPESNHLPVLNSSGKLAEIILGEL